jgi:hypothetical protein
MIKTVILSLVICSQVAETCLDAHIWPSTFETQYDCLMYGYEESMNKMREIGPADVNKYNMFIKFYCTFENTV